MQDLIFGVDGGVLVDGRTPRNASERPKLRDVTVLRDQVRTSRSCSWQLDVVLQMVGLIVSEYVSNTLFHQIYDHQLGHVSVVYSVRHIPGIFRQLAKLLCADCKLLLTANLTK